MISKMFMYESDAPTQRRQLGRPVQLSVTKQKCEVELQLDIFNANSYVSCRGSKCSVPPHVELSSESTACQVVKTQRFPKMLQGFVLLEDELQRFEPSVKPAIM